jgi:adenylosuccinate synthase
LARVEVEYETMQGWKQSIAECREYDSLPVNARKYVERVEEVLGVKVEWIGVGAARDAMVSKK